MSKFSLSAKVQARLGGLSVPDKLKARSSDIATLVIADIEDRAHLGERKYGGRLEVGSRNNMISPIQNAYEEVLDLALYLKQHLEETRDDEEVA